MKYRFLYSLILLFILFPSCEDQKTYYEQISERKKITERTFDLNKSIREIKKFEKGKIIKEETDFIEYKYNISDCNSYSVSYLFDEKGCFEIGIDGNFSGKENILDLLENFKSEVQNEGYKNFKDDNWLYRWTNDDESVSLEIDYKNIEQGLLIVTIVANV